MRMYKKAAAALLAAAMALSMMTACGGGSGSGSGVVAGVTYTSSAALVAGVDADSTTNVTPIELSKSRYAAFMQTVASNQTIYEKVSAADVVDGQLQDVRDVEQAQTEKFEYIKAAQGSQTMEYLYESAANGTYEYHFIDATEGKAAVRVFDADDETPDVPGTSDTPSTPVAVTVRSAQVTVANKPYYAEIMEISGTTKTLCYEADKPVPTYEFTTYSNGSGAAVVYNTICFGTDKGVINSRLSGYTVYTATPDGNSYTKGTLKNESTGVTYEVTYGEGDKGYTVKKNGQETDEIDWLIKAIMKEMTQD